MPLLGSMSRVFWESWAKFGFVNSNRKEPGFGKLYVPSDVGHTKGEGPGRRETLYHKAGKVMSGT